MNLTIVSNWPHLDACRVVRCHVSTPPAFPCGLILSGLIAVRLRAGQFCKDRQSWGPKPRSPERPQIANVALDHQTGLGISTNYKNDTWTLEDTLLTKPAR